MPYAVGPRSRVISTGRACRAIVAAREAGGQERAYAALRALSLAWFTTDLLLDEDEAIGRVLEHAGVPGADAITAAIGHEDTEKAYQGDRAEVRTAEGSPSSLQRRTAQSDGPERYTAPTLVFSRGGLLLEAGGHQPLGAYDVLVANLAPEATVREPAGEALEALGAFPDGLSTREVATVMAGHDEPPDDVAATSELLELVHAGQVVHEPFGGNGVWQLAA
jgi:hypothetical protein